MAALLSVMAWEVFAIHFAAAGTPAITPSSLGKAIPSSSPHAPADPAAVARGKQLFGANCAFCHGSAARGGEIGPNLLSSPVVLNDRNGEAIAVVVQNGRVNKGMPKFALSKSQVSDIAAFLHSLGPEYAQAPLAAGIPGGNPVAGKTYFYGQGHCSRCHSITGDLAGIGRKFTWMKLEDLIATGGSTGMLGTRLPGALPRTVRVTLQSGAVVEGRLDDIDDFDVTLTDKGGGRHTFTRHGAVPKIEIHDPYVAHYELLKENQSQVLHDLTAYLEGVK